MLPHGAGARSQRWRGSHAFACRPAVSWIRCRQCWSGGWPPGAMMTRHWALSRIVSGHAGRDAGLSAV